MVFESCSIECPRSERSAGVSATASAATCSIASSACRTPPDRHRSVSRAASLPVDPVHQHTLLFEARAELRGRKPGAAGVENHDIGFDLASDRLQSPEFSPALQPQTSRWHDRAPAASGALRARSAPPPRVRPPAACRRPAVCDTAGRDRYLHVSRPASIPPARPALSTGKTSPYPPAPQSRERARPELPPR